MSAIAGIVDFGGRPIDQQSITAMTNAMAHRGPDGAGRWLRGPVALGHRMLHSTLESLYEAQPVSDEEEQLFLTFDGRLDNRDDLAAMLASENLALRGDTDAEIVLRAYQAWGETCPVRFLGDFAFAIWDERNHKLFGARDQIGLRPFYYLRAGSRFLFASEIQPLFEGAHSARQLNRGALARRLLSMSVPACETLYEEVFRLPPGSSLVVTERGLTVGRYWEIDAHREIRYRSDMEYADHFRDLLERSIRCRLRGAGSVAVLLSGGVDSASVVSTMDRMMRAGSAAARKIEAFSISFEGYSGCDERDYVRRLAAQLGIEVTFFPYERGSPWFDFERIRQFPDVLYDLSNLIFAPALDAMRQRRTKILLAGFGSDELLASGFEHLQELFLRADLAGLLAALRHDSKVYANSPGYLFANHCLKPLIPRRIRKVVRSLAALRWLQQANPFALGEAARLAAREKMPYAPAPPFHLAGQTSIYRALFEGPNATTGNDTMNLFFARFGVELRCPFLDRRLVEFAFAIPQNQRWRGSQSKFVLRQAMKGIVPSVIGERTAKADISGPIFAALQHRKDCVGALLSRSTLLSLRIVNRHHLQRGFANRLGGGDPYPYDLQLLIALELWCREAIQSAHVCPQLSLVN
jgi:asparagine synthase (glutamine-hydrolysing)